MSRKPLNTAEDNYAVGFGKPPTHTQFQKGQSGNPKGRPKGVTNLATSLDKAMRERVSITENGRRITLSKLDIAVKQVVNKAAAGDMRAFQLMTGLANMVSGKENMEATQATTPEADTQVIKQLMVRMQTGVGRTKVDKEGEEL